MTPEDVRQLREDLGITQELLARLINVSFTSVNRWENDRSPPTGAALVMLRALRDAQGKSQGIGERLGLWHDRGSSYLWSRVFTIAAKSNR